MLLIILILGSQYTTYADSSILRDSVTYFYGNVNFTHEDIKITSEKGMLFKDKIIAQDSVHITQKGRHGGLPLQIFGKLGEYSWDKDIRLFNGFHALRSNELLIGDSGRYFEDTLWIYGNAVYVNDTERFKVYGDYGIYNFKENTGTITGNPIFETFSAQAGSSPPINDGRDSPDSGSASGGDDSIKITGDTIKFVGDTLARVYKNGVINLSEMQGFADSIIYFPAEEIAYLYGTPFIISDTDSLGGKQIKIVLKQRKLESMTVKGEVQGKRWKD